MGLEIRQGVCGRPVHPLNRSQPVLTRGFYGMLEKRQTIYRFGPFTLNPSKHAFCAHGSEIALAAKAFQVLLCVVRNAGCVVTKEEMLTSIWSGSIIEESNLSQHIFRLRKAMEAEPGAPSYIRTIPGVGYQFTADVQEESPPSLAAATEAAAAGSGVAVTRYRERTHTVVEDVAPAPWHLARFAAAAVVVLLVAGGGWLLCKSTRPVLARHEVVVADFDNETGDPTFNSVLKTALTIDLQQSPEITVLLECPALSVPVAKR